MPTISSLVYASGTLTSTGVQVTANDTVTIGGVTYTFKASVTTTANEVKIGADAAGSLANLKAAINASDPTVHGSLTVVNPHVVATTLTSTTLKVVSKVPGAIGNFIATTEVAATLSWGAATLASGSGSVATAISELLAGGQINADVEQTLRSMDGDSVVN
jgi:hypothetical protein